MLYCRQTKLHYSNGKALTIALGVAHCQLLFASRAANLLPRTISPRKCHGIWRGVYPRFPAAFPSLGVSPQQNRQRSSFCERTSFLSSGRHQPEAWRRTPSYSYCCGHDVSFIVFWKKNTLISSIMMTMGGVSTAKTASRAFVCPFEYETYRYILVA